MRAPLLALCVSLAALSGCASIDEAVGRPDATRWTYFEGSADRVVEAIGRSLAETTMRIEGGREEDGGTVLTIAEWNGSAETVEILVQPTEVQDYKSRAQLYPRRRPLPRWLEMDVSGRM